MNSRNDRCAIRRIHVCLFALIVGAMVLFTPMAQAETAAWTNAGSGYFTNGANWSTGIAPTNAGDTANITNKTAGYTVTLYNPTPTLTNNLLVVSNTTLVITQAVMTVTNTLAVSAYAGNSSLSPGALTLWSGGHLEIDNGGTLNITATTNNDIQWNDPNGLMILNSGGMLVSTGAVNSFMCATGGWTNHITSTTGAGGVPGSGGTLNYGGWRSLYVGRWVTNTALIIDNGVTVSNISSCYVAANGGWNSTVWVTNGASLGLNSVQAGSQLYIGNSAGSLNDGVVISNNASLYGQSITVSSASGTNNYLIATAGSIVSNSGNLAIGSTGCNSNYMILNHSTLLMPNVSSAFTISTTGGSNDYAIFTNGSSATVGSLSVGNSATSGTNNYLIMDHSTLNMTYPGTTLILGSGVAANDYMVMNCSTVNMTATYGLINIGGLTNNTLLVTGGSMVSNAEFEIGATVGGCNNGVTFNSSTNIGVGANDTIYVGYVVGTNDYLLVTNNSAVTAYSLVVGNVGGSTNCYATFSNSTLTTTISGVAINLGNAPGAMSNSLTFYNSMVALNGGTIAINVVSGNNGGSNNVMTFNNSTATLGGGITFGNDYSVGMVFPTVQGNGLIITNGSYVGTTNASCAVSLVGNGNYILIAGTNSAGRQSILDLGIGGTAASLTLYSPSTGCWIRVDAGGVISNVCGRGGICDYLGGGAYASVNDTLIITNGGRVIGSPANSYGWAIGGAANASAFGGGGIAAGMIVSGPGSVFDWSTSEVVSAYSALSVPDKNGFGTNCYLIVNNGGLVKLDTNFNAIVSVGGQANVNSNSMGNTITIASGGTLEAPGYQATNAVAGNTITNFGGIYQFAAAFNTPILTSSGGGAGIYLNSGTISYRSTSNADVYCNQPGKPLDSAAKMTFVAGGSNIFRLNWATNSSGSSQKYVFDAGFGPTNFYRLEMVTAGVPGTIPTVGGSTSYRGINGDSLTIGTNVTSGINATSYMLCSNTTARVSLIFTNNGTLSIENSTLTLGANATINGGIVIDMNNLAAGVGGATPVISASSNLTLGASSTLTLLGGTSTNMPLINYSGTLNGKFGSVVGLPQNTVISYGSGKIALAQAAAGSTMIFW